MGATTLEEAFKHQAEVWARIEAGEFIPDSRTQSLHPDYEHKREPEYGTGSYSVNKKTGEVCEWQGQWSPDGKVLLCVKCFEDGT